MNNLLFLFCGLLQNIYYRLARNGDIGHAKREVKCVNLRFWCNRMYALNGSNTGIYISHMILKEMYTKASLSSARLMSYVFQPLLRMEGCFESN